MSVVNVYKIHYHFERGGVQVSPDYVDYVQAAGSDFSSVQTVLNNNSKLRGGNTLHIDAVQNVGPNGTHIA